MPMIKTAADLQRWQQELLAEGSPTEARGIAVCCGTACMASGAQAVVEAFAEELGNRGLDTELRFTKTGCHGLCERGPLVLIHPEGTFYQRVKPEDAARIVEETIVHGRLLEDLLSKDSATGERVVRQEDVPFYRKQKRLVLGRNGHIDPESIGDYVVLGGYQALAKALFEMTSEEVIQTVIDSGLRGRGGGGFPTGRKWQSCREAPGDPHYVICNADEGDPGAFMDRSILEGNPHSVLEGMAIGAYAIGSRQGYIYVRAEYPLAVRRLEKGIAQAREVGLLGEDILGSGFSFDIEIVRGGGAFVCGESTALMASVEGRAGEPRSKYVHTVESGLWDKPTDLNNVETWANVPLIIEKGADWFAGIGTENSKGTKVFSVVGKVKNTGLVEVPMGITLRELVYDVCGGILGDRPFKAVQTGGPSGGCIPEELLDLPVDYDSLTEAGSMMGSGGVVVMDDRTCMVEVARYFTEFLVDESCGKCVPCREGLQHMLRVLTDITQGRGEASDLELLEDLAEVVTEASLCALGGTAANPVMSTLKYFREEYEAHIRDKRCPAGVCRELTTFVIDTDACTGCHACFRVCPTEAIQGERKQPHAIDQDKCIRCGACREACRFEAVVVAD